jgi:hypothetical protein
MEDRSTSSTDHGRSFNLVDMLPTPFEWKLRCFENGVID